MSDINRVSANEQAQADQQRALQNKRNPKKAQAAATQQAAGQQKAQGTEKNLKSAFDNVLDTLTDSPAVALMPSESKFDSKLQEIRRDDERGAEKDAGKEEDDKKAKDKGEGKTSTKLAAGGVKGRVEGKEGSKGQSQSGAGQEQQKGKQGDAGGAKESLAKAYRAEQFKEMQTAPAPPPLFGQTPVAGVQAPEAPAEARELPKAVLDQIINRVTILKDKDLNREIQIDFQDSFFNGLTLKVSSRDGALAVEFIAPNRNVEATFKNERERLAEALGEKGIEVRSITVSLK